MQLTDTTTSRALAAESTIAALRAEVEGLKDERDRLTTLLACVAHANEDFDRMQAKLSALAGLVEEWRKDAEPEAGDYSFEYSQNDMDELIVGHADQLAAILALSPEGKP